MEEIDFTGIADDDIIECKTPKYNYNERTTQYYKTMRKCSMCPISLETVNICDRFGFKYMWDPITGERNHEDPHGPLYFNVHYLIYTFYRNRLNHLWVDAIDESGGFYEGYFDVGIGSTDKFDVKSRGIHLEWYLFRIPIDDIYLQNDYNTQIITMGAKLTYEEIIEIYKIAKINEYTYKFLFKKPLPDLIKLYNLYNNAITRFDFDTDTNYKMNSEAVIELRKM